MQLNFFKNNNFILFKPSKYFYILSLIVLIIWFWLGPIGWRHIDDFGPMHEFLKQYVYESEYIFPKDLSNINILSVFLASLKDNYGWGSYPHIWSIIYLPLSLSFLKYGIDVTRYITILIGFISCILISFLLSNAITLIIINKKRLEDKSYQKLKFNSDFFSCLIVLFCPQIMLHSITYMPYQIASISTLIIFNIFISYQSKNIINNINNKIVDNKIIILSKEYVFLIAWLSILLSWQSLLILIALFLYFVIYSLFNINYQYKYLIFKNIINLIKEYFIGLKFNAKYIIITIFFPFLFYLSRIYIIKFINLNKLGHINGMPFAWGNGNEYNLNILNSSITSIELKDLFPNLIFLLGRIFSLALYPFRIYQNISAFLLLIIFAISIYFMYRYTKVTSNLALLIFFSFLVPIIFSISGKFILAPSRHAIYLFPCIWIPVGAFFVKQSLYYKTFKVKYLSIFVQIFLIFIFMNGLISSHKAINYSPIEKSKIFNLVEKADYFPLGKFMGQYDLLSLFWTHGTKEWDLLQGKECKLDNGSLIGKSIFLFSHTEAFKNNTESIKNLIDPEYFPKEYACIKENNNLKIIDSFIIERSTDIEVDNLIENGGSNAYAYLLKVSK